MWTPNVIDRRSDVIATTYKLKRPVRRQLLKTVITTGVTVNYDICLYKDGVLHTSVRVMLGNPSFYSSPESYAASNYVAVGAQAFYDVAISDGVAVVVSFPGWYERLSEKSATACCSVFITGEGFERFSIRTVTSQGTIATAVPVDDSHDPNYKYLLTVDSGSGQWIADLSAMDRYRTLYEFNLSQNSGSEVVPVVTVPVAPVAPSLGSPPPQEVVVPVDQSQLYAQVATLSNVVQILSDRMLRLQQSIPTREELRVMNSNVIVAGHNIAAVGDFIVASSSSRGQRLVENASMSLLVNILAN